MAMTADPASERALLAGFRVRTATVARNAAWITLAGIALLTAPHHAITDINNHALIWSLLLAAALGNLLTYFPIFTRVIQESHRDWPFWAWTLLLLSFDAAVVFLSRDAQHQIYLIYIPVLLFAVATLGAWSAAGAIVLSLGTALGAAALGGDLTGDVAVASVTSFIVVAVLGSYFAREQREEMAESAHQRAQAVRHGRDLAAAHDRAIALNNELQETVGKVIKAQEEERRRIGRELHDEAVQMLSAAAVHVGDLQRRIPKRQQHVQEGLAEVHEILTDALWEIRKIIVDLRPSGLDDLGLVPALGTFVRDRLEASGVAVETHLSRTPEPLPPNVETAVFRIAQEAVNNVARHANAHHVAVTFGQQNGAVMLRVDDDGDGFDPAAVHSNGNGEGLGLLGMRERAALLGGTFRLEARPGEGTSIVVSIPVATGAGS